MILSDAGPLVALLDPRQQELHHRARSLLQIIPSPLITTWPCFTEAMHLLGRIGGWRLQELLWKMVDLGSLELRELEPLLLARMASLMANYVNVPMDLADASLIALAEHAKLDRVFTFDRDFEIYRLSDGKALSILP